MKIEHTNVYNIGNAIRGMRNPLASWQKSDSAFGVAEMYGYEIDEAISDISEKYLDEKRETDRELIEEKYEELNDDIMEWLYTNGCSLDLGAGEHAQTYAFIGPNDMDLAKRLIKAGPEHRKFLRQIFVSADITAPLYLWKELDTYKLGTTANSTSTMHKLASKPITLDCFETEDLDDTIFSSEIGWFDGHCAINRKDFIIATCELLRQKYLETKDKRYWKELVRWLPNGWLQTRTITFNYEVLRNIYKQRAGHKLTEWEAIRSWIETLPYAKEFICDAAAAT